MNKSFDMFDEIWCINLNKIKDRWKLAVEEFEKLGIDDRVQRFAAVEHKDGRIGLIKSFLHLFKYAKQKGLKNILIFEDDIKFLNNPSQTLEAVKSQLQSFDMLYLGANTHTKLQQYSENVYHLNNAFAAHAICYNESVYDEIIERFEKTNQILKQEDINDVFFCSLQNKYKCYLTYPLLATQRPSFSNLDNRNVDYSFIEERYKVNVK